MEEYRTMKEVIRKAMQEKMKGTREEVEKAVEAVTEAVMGAISENYRSITEVHSIVECVRAGIPVQIAYADPDELEDELEFGTYVAKPCW